MNNSSFDGEEPGKPGYEVGYGRPPRKHQFKPGNPGNRQGRKKGSRNVKTILRDEMNKKISVKVDGKIKKLEKSEALVQIAAQKALSGDNRAIDRVFRLLEDYGLTDEVEKTQEIDFAPEFLTQEERDQFRALLIKATPRPADDEEPE